MEKEPVENVNQDPLFDAESAAAYLGLVGVVKHPAQAVRTLCRKRHLRSTKVAGKVMIRKTWLEEYLAAKTRHARESVAAKAVETSGSCRDLLQDHQIHRDDRLAEILTELKKTNEMVAELLARNSQPLSDYLTITETARLLKVGEDMVQRLISTGQLNASVISAKGNPAGPSFKQIHRHSLERFIIDSQVPVTPSTRRRRYREPTKDYFPDV